MNKFCNTYLLEQGVIVVGVSFAVPPLLLRLEYVCLCITSRKTIFEVSGSIKVLEYVFGIKKFRVNGLRGKKFAANDKYLRGDISGELLVTTHECWTRNHTGMREVSLPQPC